MTIVEALKKVVKAYDGAESKAKTTVDALEDIVIAMGGTPSGGNTVQQVIEDIAATIEAGGGGGGGSSDFSTATITIVDPDELMEGFYGPVIADGKAYYQFKDDPSDGITVILYDGNAVVGIDTLGSTIITCSGNITDEGGSHDLHEYIVTGNASLTFSAS